MSDNLTTTGVPKAQAKEPAPVVQLRELINNRKLTKEFAQSAEFEGLVGDIDQLLRDEDPYKVCLGLSVASRAASVSKPMAEIFAPYLVSRLKTAELPFVVLDDGEDRWYLAKAMQFADPNNAADVAFREIVREDVGEKARKVWIEIAFAAAISKESLLRKINLSISRVFGSKRSRSDPLARRIRRIVAALKDELILSEISTGPEYGKQLHIFLSGHFTIEGPEEKSLREEYGGDVLAALGDIARLSLTVSSDPETYLIVSEIKNWWRPASAPAAVEGMAAKLAMTGIETLLVFARQGHQNTPLRKNVLEAIGRNVYERLMEKAVNSDATLSEEMATWLITGGAAKNRRTSEVVEVLSAERTNEDISRLLVFLAASEMDASSIMALSMEIDELMPEQGASISEIAKRVKQVSQIVGSMAKRRHLHLFLQAGDVVRFDPAQHEPIDEIPVGNSSLVVRSGTRLKEPGRPERILLKPRVRSI